MFPSHPFKSRQTFLTSASLCYSAGIHSFACGLSLWQRENGQFPAEKSSKGQRKDKGRKPVSAVTSQREQGGQALFFPPAERLHTPSSGCSAGPHTHHQPAAAPRSIAQRAHQRESAQALHLALGPRVEFLKSGCVFQNGNSALSIARRLGYISVVDTLKVISEETLTTQVCVWAHCWGSSHRSLLFLLLIPPNFTLQWGLFCSTDGDREAQDECSRDDERGVGHVRR